MENEIIQKLKTCLCSSSKEPHFLFKTTFIADLQLEIMFPMDGFDWMGFEPVVQWFNVEIDVSVVTKIIHLEFFNFNFAAAA